MTKKGRPKKQVRYNKTINIRLTHEQWVEVLNWAQKAHLEPSVYIRKILLDFLNIYNTDFPTRSAVHSDAILPQAKR
jgi:hypothetical protein